MLAGCASSDEPIARTGYPLAGRQPDLAVGLLFDRYPGPYDARDFAVRSDWPSTDSYYSPGQVIIHRERFVDYYGRNFDEPGYTYRRAESYRYSVGFK
jgi:hypothetical protein